VSRLPRAARVAGRLLVPRMPDDLGGPARRRHRRETGAWLLLAAALGSIEGGVTGVIAKNAFEGRVNPWLLAAAVALLSGAPALANLSSFVWAGLASGRHKVRFLVALQVATAACVALIAFAGPGWGSTGLLLLVVGGLGGRICWAGVVTLRATVWRANHPRSSRALVAGRIAAVQAVMLAAASFAIGKAMEIDERSFHVLYPAAALLGIVGAGIYGRTRVKGHRALLDRERASTGTSPLAALNPARTVAILREDRDFRRYMEAMFLFGLGNIALTPILVLLISDRYGFGYLSGVLVTTTIPIVVMPFVIPIWARLLDRMHIVRFRTFHCWAFLLTNLLVLLAAIFHLPSLIWIAAVGRGVAFAGGVLGWNLGHTDFAPPERTSEYMGVHATLTGVRGLIGPALAVGIYTVLEGVRPGAGAVAFAACLLSTAAGTVLFYRHARALDPARAGGGDVESPATAAATHRQDPRGDREPPAEAASISGARPVHSPIPRSPRP